MVCHAGLNPPYLCPAKKTPALRYTTTKNDAIFLSFRLSVFPVFIMPHDILDSHFAELLDIYKLPKA